VDAGGELVVREVIELRGFRAGLARQDGQGGAHEVLRPLGRHRLDRRRPMLAPDLEKVGDKRLPQPVGGVVGVGKRRGH